MILELNLYTSCKLFHKEKEENLYLFANAKKLMQTTIGIFLHVQTRRMYECHEETRLFVIFQDAYTY